MKHAAKKRAVQLRKEGKTYQEIRTLVPVSKSTLSLWLREVGLAKQQAQRITAKKRAAQKKGGATRRIMREESTAALIEQAQQGVGALSPRELLLVGTALYWAEGSKQHAHSKSVGVLFSNGDAAMHRVFLQWLSLVGVSYADLIFELYVHEERRKESPQFVAWWKKALALDSGVPMAIYAKKGNRNTMRKNTGALYHGLLRIKVRRSTNLNRRIQGWIQGICADTWGIV